jgi:hypothetical protein
MRNAYKILESMTGTDHMEDLDRSVKMDHRDIG